MNAEDEVVVAFADQLRSKGYLVLAEGGNQAAAFRYAVGGLVKAPDVVALRAVELLVAEGKVQSSDLFQSGARGISDFDACSALDRDPAAKFKIAEEAVRRCQVSGLACSAAQSLEVQPVLFAHRVRVGDIARATEAQVPLISVT